MKYQSFSLALTIVLTACLAACVGQRARQHTQLPTMRLAIVGIEQDAERGIADAVEDGDLTAADGEAANERLDLFVVDLMGEDVQTVVQHYPAWSEWKALAVRGINDRVEDGEWSAGVSGFALERLDNFEAAFDKLVWR